MNGNFAKISLFFSRITQEANINTPAPPAVNNFNDQVQGPQVQALQNQFDMMGLENDWQELEDYDEDGAPINQKKKKKVELIGIVNKT